MSHIERDDDGTPRRLYLSARVAPPKKRHKWTSWPGGDAVCALCGLTLPTPLRSPIPPCTAPAAGGGR